MPVDNNDYSNLDFFQNRDEVKDFLANKTEFRDFDFEGSGMSILLDALAYFTTQMGLYANMSISECFLNSAQIRSNVVSKAEELGYQPRSKTAATMEIDLVFNGSKVPAADVVLPKGSIFSTSNGSDNFQFVTEQEYKATIDGTTFTFSGVVLYEGVAAKQKFKVSSNFQTFRISNKSVDTDTIVVYVDGVKYSMYDNLLELDSESLIFYVREGLDGFQEIVFGDNILGVSPEIDSIIEIEYLVTHGAEANGVNRVSLDGSIKYQADDSSYETLAGNSADIEIVASSTGGSNEEELDSIRLNAPLLYSSQNRAVTVEDYIALIKKNYGGIIDTISVWGGEENDPPLYGRVVIAIKPTFGETLSPRMKNEIKQMLMDHYTIVNITPEFVDPTFVYVTLDSLIYYDPGVISDPSSVSNGVRQAVKDYLSMVSSNEKESFRFSTLTRRIDESVQGIVSDNTTMRIMVKKQNVKPDHIQFSFGNQLRKETFSTNLFRTQSNVFVQLKDNGRGQIDLYDADDYRISGNVGTIDYETGDVLMNINLVIPSTETIKFSAEPKNYDIDPGHSSIVLDESNDSKFVPVVNK